MTPPPKSKPLPHVTRLRRKLRHLPTNNSNPENSNVPVRLRKCSCLYLKITKNLSDAPSLSITPKPAKKTLHNDHSQFGRYPEDISCTLKNLHLSDDSLIGICSKESPSDGTSTLTRHPATLKALTQETAPPPPIHRSAYIPLTSSKASCDNPPLSSPVTSDSYLPYLLLLSKHNTDKIHTNKTNPDDMNNASVLRKPPHFPKPFKILSRTPPHTYNSDTNLPTPGGCQSF